MKKRAVPEPWLETLRLSMREFTPDDFDDLHALNADPRVMKYIADGTPSTREQVAGALKRFIRYAKLYPDLGVWHTSRRDTGAFIGFFALNYAGKSTDIEIGYRLRPNAWGLGFATEGATALVQLRLRRARPRPDHRRHASRQQGVAARADEGGPRRLRLGPLLRPSVAPLRRRTRRVMTPTVRQALAQSGLVPVDARVLLAPCARRAIARGSPRTRKMRSRASRPPRSLRWCGGGTTVNPSPISPAPANSGVSLSR